MLQPRGVKENVYGDVGIERGWWGNVMVVFLVYAPGKCLGTCFSLAALMRTRMVKRESRERLVVKRDGSVLSLCAR